ncbi:unnamed protein product [Paramecium primaurelia]|uniref:Uncharacterized protein n=1 Tax=Paramecium primaurelia TaxID=5886 RepID=A0A8S1Q2J9_PARPR|nr:unnamed protein product [Paramecium primaurelia]
MSISNAIKNNVAIFLSTPLASNLQKHLNPPTFLAHQFPTLQLLQADYIVWQAVSAKLVQAVLYYQHISWERLSAAVTASQFVESISKQAAGTSPAATLQKHFDPPTFIVQLGSVGQALQFDSIVRQAIAPELVQEQDQHQQQQHRNLLKKYLNKQQVPLQLQLSKSTLIRQLLLCNQVQQGKHCNLIKVYDKLFHQYQCKKYQIINKVHEQDQHQQQQHCNLLKKYLNKYQLTKSTIIHQLQILLNCSACRSITINSATFTILLTLIMICFEQSSYSCTRERTSILQPFFNYSQQDLVPLKVEHAPERYVEEKHLFRVQCQVQSSSLAVKVLKHQACD